MAGSCFCTGACDRLGYCPHTGVIHVAPLKVGHGKVRERPLREEDVRRIVREEIGGGS